MPSFFFNFGQRLRVWESERFIHHFDDKWFEFGRWIGFRHYRSDYLVVFRMQSGKVNGKTYQFNQHYTQINVACDLLTFES